MGFKVTQFVPLEPIKIENLKGKIIAIDAYNILYKFLKTLPPLTDRFGRPTSHLVGLFFRTTRLISLGIKLCFVFDGAVPTIARHKKITKEIPEPRYTATITPEIVQSSKTLLDLLGLPIVQAPSEGEAQAAWICRKGDAYAVGSEDYDSLIFGAPKMIKNLTFAKQRRLPSSKYVLIGVYLIELKKLLKDLGINFNQLIALAMLCGTDYNPSPRGIGPKKGLELVKQYGKNFNTLFKAANWSYAYSWKKVFDCIKTMPVTNKYKLRWRSIDEEGVIDFLVKERNFNLQRVKNALERCKSIQ